MPTFNTSTAAHQRARHVGTFVALSLLIHAALFFALNFWQRNDMAPSAQAARHGPISVRLLEATAPPSQTSVPAPEAALRPPAKTTKKPMLAKRKPALPSTAKREPPTMQQDAPSPAPPEMDMMTMLNAARERRRAADQSAAIENGLASEGAKSTSANDIALANINRDLQRQSGKSSGIGGVFQLVSKGVRTAQFQFRGWNPGSANSWRQTIEVDAGPNGDVELAIVQRMITLIRSHYSGDFNWESHRLGRVVVLSARPSDNAELEAFLMREFFRS